MNAVHPIILLMGLCFVFMSTGIAYLVTLLELTGSLQKHEAKYWAKIGSPSNSDPNGQAKVLGLIFLPNRLPQDILEKYKKKIYIIRACATLSVVSFALLVTLLKLDVFADLN